MKDRNRKQRKETESVLESVSRLVHMALQFLVCICTILILAVMPFYFREGYTHIGTDKSYFFRTAAVRMGSLLLPVLAVSAVCAVATGIVRGFRETLRKWMGGLCATDFFAFFYGLSVILSYFGSDYKKTALWGTRGWFMGCFPQLMLVALYFLLSRFQPKAKWMLRLCMPVSAAVFLLGCLNRFDIWPLPMPNSGRPLYISTIGNINWYCGYMVTVLFVGVGLLWLDRGDDKRRASLLSAYVLLGFAALVTQGSDSGLFALAAVLLAMLMLSAKDGDSMGIRRFWLILMLFALACIVIMAIRLCFPGRMNYVPGSGNLLTCSPAPVLLLGVAAFGLRRVGAGGMRLLAKICRVALPVLGVVFLLMIAVNTWRPGSLGGLSDKGIFTFDNHWGSSRGATWRIGLSCFAGQDLLHKLVGVGPDCMADYLYSADAGAALTESVRETFGDRRLTNAHCELLTTLVNMGLLGCVCFGGMMISVTCRLLRARRYSVYAAACGLCVLAYMANNLWSFQQSMSAATVVCVMGLGERCARRN